MVRALGTAGVRTTTRVSSPTMQPALTLDALIHDTNSKGWYMLSSVNALYHGQRLQASYARLIYHAACIATFGMLYQYRLLQGYVLTRCRLHHVWLLCQPRRHHAGANRHRQT